MKDKVTLKDHERIDQLYPGKRDIIQSKQVFSHSVDAVLLAHFAQIPNQPKSKIVDLCSGNGAVTMLVADQTQAPVTGIEIQADLVDMANRSACMNDLDQQIVFLNLDIKDFEQAIRPGSVDVITCNPPYFQSAEHKQNRNQAYALARHEITLDLHSLLDTISKMLKQKGVAYLVYSTERFIELMDACLDYHLIPKHLQIVYPKPNRPSKFFLIKLIKAGSKAGFRIGEPLYIMDEDDQYSKEMSQIFYGE